MNILLRTENAPLLKRLLTDKKARTNMRQLGFLKSSNQQQRAGPALQPQQQRAVPALQPSQLSTVSELDNLPPPPAPAPVSQKEQKNAARKERYIQKQAEAWAAAKAATAAAKSLDLRLTLRRILRKYLKDLKWNRMMTIWNSTKAVYDLEYPSTPAFTSAPDPVATRTRRAPAAVDTDPATADNSALRAGRNPSSTSAPPATPPTGMDYRKATLAASPRRLLPPEHQADLGKSVNFSLQPGNTKTAKNTGH
jgi:hypothetical protein